MKRFTISVVLYFLLGVFSHALAQGRGEDRWGINFKETCFSPALDADISFSVRMPPKVSDLEKCPLVVVIKNGLKVAPSADHPFIELKAPTGGIWGYRSMSGVLVRTAIAHMKQNYPIDEDRIYLVGFSAGASGAMQVASTHADQYAAVLPLVAVGTDYPIANFRNLPVAQHHGTLDWTSAICNARGQHQRMLAMGCPVELTEYRGVGHSVPRPHEPIVEWMLKQRREKSPEVVMIDCATPSLGSTHWIHIESFIDPHQRARVRGSLTGEEDGRRALKIETENVENFAIDFDLLNRSNQSIGDVVVDGKLVSISWQETTGLWYFGWLKNGDDWRKARPAVEERSGIDEGRLRSYQAGAAASLYQGEPLLMVYGTAGDNAPKLLNVAKRLAACGGPHPGAMGQRFRIVADRDLSAEQQEKCNLILVGAPEENIVANRLLSALPVKIEAGNLDVEERRSLALKNRVLSLLSPNPEHPGRLIYLIAPFVEGEDGWKRFGENPQRFLIGSDGFDRISQADLAVKNLDQQFCRQMQFGHEWKWQSKKGEDRRLPERFGDRRELARECMKSMRKKSGADFALWWGPADKGMWGHDMNFLPRFDPADYTLADYRTQRREFQTLTGSVSGEELREIWQRWGGNEEVIFEPAIDLSKIDDERNYRLHVPMDFYIKLGQRKKALVDPMPGPRINMRDLEAAIFGE